MFNLTLSQSRRLSLSPSRKTSSSSSSSLSSSSTSSSSSSSSSSRPSLLPSFRRSHKSDTKRQSFDSYQSTFVSSSSGYAEDMDDDNVAWGPVSRKKRVS